MKKVLCFLTIFCLSVLPARAAVVGFASNSLWFSAPAIALEGEPIKIYTNIVNGDLGRFEGDLVFYANEKIIANSIHFNIAPDESRLFSVVWPASTGDFKFTARIINDAIYNQKNEQQNVIINRYLSSNQELLSVDNDTDHDGLGDKVEIAAGTDPNQADTDGDGYSDKDDQSPLNNHIFPGADTDGDGISDKVDTDIDNDGLYNWEEEKLMTDSYKRDTDGDGIFDKEDAFPLDPKKWLKENSINLTIEPLVSSNNQTPEQLNIKESDREATTVNNIDQQSANVIPIISGLANDSENPETNQSNLKQYGEMTLSDSRDSNAPKSPNLNKKNGDKLSLVSNQNIQKKFFISKNDLNRLLKNPIIVIPLGLIVISLLAGIISFILFLRAKRQANRDL